MPDDGSRKRKKNAGDKAKKQSPPLQSRSSRLKIISLLLLSGAIAALAVTVHRCRGHDNAVYLPGCFAWFFGESPKEQTHERENQEAATELYWRNVIAGIAKKVDHDAAAVLREYEAENPSSPEALYGKAKALDTLAEEKRSNALLQKAIAAYLTVINSDQVHPLLLRTAAERCVDRMQFIGHYGRAVAVHMKLIQRYPEVAEYRNNLAVAYLTVNNVREAKRVLEETLAKWPESGVALVHYGFILKTSENKLEEAVDHMRRGIATGEPGVIDGRFYFHIGDALSRLGKANEAMEIYEQGVANKLFLSKYQRSLYNVKRLTGKPWWRQDETPYESFFKLLEDSWEKIRDEGLAALNENGQFQDESENLKDSGDWKQLELFARGAKNVDNCKKCPLTCRLIETHPDARGCRRGQSKFSVMHPGTHVWAHCGPTNCRLRAHLGLRVPENTFIRVSEETRSWEEGRVFVFDDSFEHEVWHNGTEPRLVLIVDLWHPELTADEKRSLSPI